MNLPLCIYGDADSISDLNRNIQDIYNQLRTLSEGNIDGFNLHSDLLGDGLEFVDQDIIGSEIRPRRLYNSLAKTTGNTYFSLKGDGFTPETNYGMELIVDEDNAVGRFCVVDKDDLTTQRMSMVPLISAGRSAYIVNGRIGQYGTSTANNTEIIYNGSALLTLGTSITSAANILPSATNTWVLGSAAAAWQEIFTRGIDTDGAQNLVLYRNNVIQLTFGGTNITSNDKHLVATTTNTADLGTSSVGWKELYVRTIDTDGANNLVLQRNNVTGLTLASSAVTTPFQIQSTLAIGTAPFSITSTTKVDNLYVDRAVLSDTVTTNANLTGPITSVGNATTVADAELSAIAGLTSAANKLIRFTGSGTADLLDVNATSAATTVPIADGSGDLDAAWIPETLKTGRLVSVTLLTSSSANHATGSTTNKIYVRVQAGGGGGGGASSAGSSAACGAGGGPGGYSEHLFTVTPSTEYAYTCGAAGTAGANTGGNGGNGGNSTFVVGGTTVQGNGGTGGAGQTAGTSAAFTQGGNEGSSSGGTLNARSTGGLHGQRVSGTVGISGHGGGAFFGNGGVGRASAGQGDSAAGYGGGGGGGLVLNGSAAVTGGAGAAGAILVYEYT